MKMGPDLRTRCPLYTENGKIKSLSHHLSSPNSALCEDVYWQPVKILAIGIRIPDSGHSNTGWNADSGLWVPKDADNSKGGFPSRKNNIRSVRHYGDRDRVMYLEVAFEYSDSAVFRQTGVLVGRHETYDASQWASYVESVNLEDGIHGEHVLP
jgi:hypothetical protein